MLTTGISSNPEDNFPEYVELASHTFDEASEPIIAELGILALDEASELTALDAQATSIPNEATEYIQEHDITANFTHVIDQITEEDISIQTKRYAATEALLNGHTDVASDLYTSNQATIFKFLARKAMSPTRLEELRTQFAQDPGSLELPESDRWSSEQHRTSTPS